MPACFRSQYAVYCVPRPEFDYSGMLPWRLKQLLQVAAALSSGDCLVLTELLMHGALSSLTAVQITSVLSCFVWSETTDRGGLKIRDELKGAVGALRESARRVGNAQQDSGMACDVDGFINSFRPDLIDIITLWASKSSFAEVWLLIFSHPFM